MQPRGVERGHDGAVPDKIVDVNARARGAGVEDNHLLPHIERAAAAMAGGRQSDQKRPSAWGTEAIPLRSLSFFFLGFRKKGEKRNRTQK